VGTTADYELPERLLCHDIKKVIFSAFRSLVNRHPSLGIISLGDNFPTARWCRLPYFDFKIIVRFVERSDQVGVTSIIEDWHQHPIFGLQMAPSVPLWRAIVIYSKSSTTETPITITFLSHPTIADGRSGVAFHMELLDILDSLKIENEQPNSRVAMIGSVPMINSIAIVPTLQLLPALEDVLSFPISPFFRANQFYKSVWPWRNKLCWTGPSIRAEPSIGRLRILDVPSQLTCKLLALCQENNVKLTALLSILIARVLAMNYPTYKRFKGSITSFRRFTATNDREIVNYTTYFEQLYSTDLRTGYFLCGGELSWDTVLACNKEIEIATSNPKNQWVGLLRYIEDYGEWCQNRIGREREYSFELSNVGVIDGGNGECRIKKMMSSQSCNIIGAPFVFSVATVKGGPLTIALSWQQDVIETEMAEKVRNDLCVEMEYVAEMMEDDTNTSGIKEKHLS
jgi:hypothetical protein